ncbi:MAG: hypothetical protein Q7S08_03005 [bacterium]|nr:hypothetical protein [bacterium]
MSESGLEKSSKKSTPVEHNKSASFLDKPVTRRDALKGIAVVGAAYMIKDFGDYKQEELDQFEVPTKMREALELMDRLNLELPEDKLYGFKFPTTGEMAGKYKDALERQVGNPSIPSLIVVQERKPKTVIGSIMHYGQGITAPRISRPNSPDSPSSLYLPDYSEKYSVQEMVLSAYHEGYHLFYQAGVDNSAQGSFDAENITNIADILLSKLLDSLKYRVKSLGNEATKAYENAVAQNDKTIWEKYLKELYKLPENCCNFDSPMNTP